MLKLKLSQFIVVRIVFALAVILFMVFSYLVLLRINRQVASAELVSKTNLIRFYVERILTKVQYAEAGQRGYLLTHDSDFLNRCHEAQLEINSTFVAIDSIALGHYTQNRVDSFRSLVERRMAMLYSIMKRNSHNVSGVTMKEALAPGMILMDSVRNYARQLEQNELQLLQKEQLLNKKNIFLTPRFVFVLIMFALIVFTLAYISLNQQLRISRYYLQQRQKAAEDLADMNLIYQNAEQIASLGSWEWNLETNTFKCSDNLFRIYGSEPREEEISFKRFMSFVVTEDREMLTKYIQEAITSKETSTATYKIKRADGVVRHMRAIGKLMDNKGQIMLGATQDVTEIAEAVEKLQASESFNRSITELVPNVIYIFDLDERKLMYINTYPKEILGFTYEDLTTAEFNFFQLIHPGDLPLIEARREHFRHLKDKEVITLQYRVRHKNGEWISIYDRTTSFKRKDNGEVAQIIGVASDVTEIRRVNERLFTLNNELEVKNRELQQINAELSSFNFIASHDLQEPLRKIQTFVSFLEETENNLSDSGKFYLQRMQHAAARIRSLIQDIITYSHATLSEKDLESVDLNEALNNVLQSLEMTISEKKILINAQKLPVVRGNWVQLQQLFENLLSNAFKYSKFGITPEISITSEIVKNVGETVAGLTPGRTYHKISFADNGIGFEQEYASKIFDLFQRLHSKNDYEGRGIGLAICKKIVQHHGGAIEARSIPGQGSVFNIYLPED